MGKNQELLDSGEWYYVDVKIDDKEKERIVIDQQEYNTLIEGLNNDGKFLKVGDNHYFWTKIDSFGPIKFEKGVLDALKQLDRDTQDFIKKRIRAGIQITTLDNLRSEVAFFNSR